MWNLLYKNIKVLWELIVIDMLNYLSKSIILIIFLFIIIYGMFKGRKVYEWFIEGVKDGLKVCFRIFFYFLVMIIVV